MAMLRQFPGLSLERIPDETTVLNFRAGFRGLHFAAPSR